MLNGHKILALIPARGGSKGLPNKNIMNLSGKPMIKWTIDEAKKLKWIDKIVVSTDSEKIIDECKEPSIDIPFVRPSSLSTDTASSIDVVLHALNWLENKNLYFDIIILLEPTSPLREAIDIESALQLMFRENAKSVVGVSKVVSSHPEFMYEKKENNYIVHYNKIKSSQSRRQDVDILYYLEGSIYASFVNDFKKNKTFYHKNTIGYEVSKIKSFEIDDIEDFVIVESLLNHKFK